MLDTEAAKSLHAFWISSQGETLTADMLPSTDQRRRLATRAMLLGTALAAEDRTAVRRMITAMLAALRSRTADAAVAETQVATYEAAVKGMPSWAVIRVAEKFIRGQIVGVNKAFPPTTAEFYTAVAEYAAPYRLEAQRISMVLRAKPAAPMPERSGRPLPKMQMAADDPLMTAAREARQRATGYAERANETLLARDHAQHGTDPAGASPGLIANLKQK